MASPVYALYCFEVLNASLKHTAALSLDQLDQYWHQSQEEHTSSKEPSVPLEQHISLSPVPDYYNRLVVPSSSPSTGSSTPSNASNTSSSSISVSSSQTSMSSGIHNLRKRGATAEAQHPLFVTWNILGRSGSKSLRGCIGTFEAQPLEYGLKSYALTSAFDDTRFRPISANDLKSLECDVTLLTDFEPAPLPMDWEIGKHGIRISFTQHSRRYGATYLPNVAQEQGWTKTETLVSLMRKAGWNGKKEEWMDVGDLKVTRYQGMKVEATYSDWKDLRQWISQHELTAPTSN